MHELGITGEIIRIAEEGCLKNKAKPASYIHAESSSLLSSLLKRHAGRTRQSQSRSLWILVI